MTRYLVRGFTKTDTYKETIETDKGMESAFTMGKAKINAIPPLSPIRSWCIDREQ